MRSGYSVIVSRDRSDRRLHFHLLTIFPAGFLSALHDGSPYCFFPVFEVEGFIAEIDGLGSRVFIRFRRICQRFCCLAVHNLLRVGPADRASLLQGAEVVRSKGSKLEMKVGESSQIRF